MWLYLCPDIFNIHLVLYTVEHTFDACPKYSEFGSFPIIAYLYDAAVSAKVQKKSTAFLYIAKQNHRLYTIYRNRRVQCVFYSSKAMIRIAMRMTNIPQTCYDQKLHMTSIPHMLGQG